MNHLLVTTDNYLYNKFIKSFTSNNPDHLTLTFDMDEKSLYELLVELNTFSMFDEKKIIIVKNFFNHNYQELEINNLLLYLKDPNLDQILLITSPTVDKRTKTYKSLSKSLKIYDEEYNIFNEVKSLLSPYKMDYQTTNYFINYLGNDINIMVNEIEKLKLYKNEQHNISVEDIDNLVIRKLEDNVFNLTNSIMEQDREKALKIYEDLLANKEETTKLILLVANQFILLKTVKEEGLKDKNKDLASLLGIHPYRIKLAKQYAQNYELSKLQQIVIHLAKIDYQIKSGKLLPSIAFELFLIKI